MTGGRITIRYQEATSRGHPTRLRCAERVRFVVERDRPDAFDAIEGRVGIDAAGIPFAEAGPPRDAVPALTALMRAGHRQRVERLRSAENDYEPLAEFSLSGFSAALAKTSDWCTLTPS